MNKANYTPSPWWVGSQYEILKMPEQIKIAKVSGANSEEAKTNLALIAAAPDLFEAVEKAQAILAKWIVPDSDISDKTALEDLVGVLDNVQLVQKMRFVEPLKQEKLWSTSDNIEKTSYDKHTQELEILFRNGKSYRYKEVPLEVWVKLKEASSIGSFLHSEIKGHYGYYEIK